MEIVRIKQQPYLISNIIVVFIFISPEKKLDQREGEKISKEMKGGLTNEKSNT